MRCQAAIIQNHHILLILDRDPASGRAAWLLPGAPTPADGDERCLVQVLKEETGLDVCLGRLLFEDHLLPGDTSLPRKIFLCLPRSGQLAIGPVSQPPGSSLSPTASLGWFDLHEPLDWQPEVLADPILFPLLLNIRRSLGY